MKRTHIVVVIVICALIAGTFLLIPGRQQRDFGIDFGRLNDRVLVGTIALIVGVVLVWKVYREGSTSRFTKHI